MALRALALVLALAACTVDAGPPADWVERRSQGLIVTVPAAWGEPRPGEVTPTPPVRGWVFFPAGDVAVWLWSGGDVERLVDEHVVRGNLQPIERRAIVSPRRGLELLIGGIRWSDPARGSGAYEARHLFVQLAPDVIGDFVVTARPLVSGRESRVSDEQRRVQDLVVRHASYAP